MEKFAGSLIKITIVMSVVCLLPFLFPGKAAADVTLYSQLGHHVIYIDPLGNQTYDADGNGVTVIPSPANGLWRVRYVEPVAGTVWFGGTLTILNGAVIELGDDWDGRPIGRWRTEDPYTVLCTPVPVINVKDYGVKGDGLTDDTVLLKEIFNNVQDGQVIYFPEGQYIISDTLTVAYRWGVKILMDGGFRSDGARLSNDRGIYWSLTGPSDERPMMKIDTCSQMVISGLKMDGGSVVKDGLVLDSAGSSTNFECSNVHIRSCARYGLRVNTWRAGHPTGGTQLDMVSFRESRFTNCGSASGTTDSAVTVESAQSLQILFDTCTFTVSGADLAEYQVYMRGGSANFENCVFLDGNNTFADIYFAPDCYTSAVSVTKCHQEGVALGSNYFLYVERPGAGAVAQVLLERLGASGNVYFNAATSLQISNGSINNVNVPNTDARVLLSNLRILGTVTLGTTHVVKQNITLPTDDGIVLATSNNFSVNTDGNVTAVKSLSNTTTAAKNLRGQATLNAGTGSLVVTFPTAEPDASYYILLTGDGDNRLWVTNKTATSFTINRSSTTGIRKVDWFLIR